MRKLDRSPASLEKVFTAIRALHARYPDLRFGQMLVNVMSAHSSDSYQLGHIFTIENDDLEGAIKKFTEGLDSKR